jgi:hypothetical protein
MHQKEKIALFQLGIAARIASVNGLETVNILKSVYLTIISNNI